MFNTSRAQLVRYTLTTLGRCWEGCITPTAFAPRSKSVEYSSYALAQDGYCGVTFKEVSSTTPDAFSLLPNPSSGAQVVCPASYVYIPRLRWSNISSIKIHLPFQSRWCQWSQCTKFRLLRVPVCHSEYQSFKQRAFNPIHSVALPLECWPHPQLAMDPLLS